MELNRNTVEVVPLTWVQKARQWLTLILALLGALSGGTAVVMHGRSAGAPQAQCPPSCSPPAPMPEAPAQPQAKLTFDPVNAVVRIQFGNAGCSGTFVGPILPDGRLQLLTASHCLKGQPKNGVAVFRDGTTVRIVQQGNWEGPDVGWCVTELPVAKSYYTMLADAMPSVGDKVYHCGFGVDVPGNRENGVVVRPDNGEGQTQYQISVSSGDSGGGIALNEKGHILSPVCCTTAKGQRAQVWGATVEQCRKLRPLPSPVLEEWTPIDIPMKMDAP